MLNLWHVYIRTAQVGWDANVVVAMRLMRLAVGGARAVSILCWHRRGRRCRGPMSSWLATPLSYVFNTGFRRGSAVNSQQKNPGRSRGQIASDRLAVLLLSALALSASGLLLLLAWLLLAAAALLLARLVLATPRGHVSTAGCTSYLLSSIKSSDEPHERVVKESDLKRDSRPPAAAHSFRPARESR